MSTHSIAIKSGSSKRLPTAGKYCDRDIIVTAYGDSGDGTFGTGTVNIDMVSAMNADVEVWYTKFLDGAIVQTYTVVAAGTKVSLKNVVTGSIIITRRAYYIMLSDTESNVITTMSDGNNEMVCFKVVATESNSQNIAFWE